VQSLNTHEEEHLQVQSTLSDIEDGSVEDPDGTKKAHCEQELARLQDLIDFYRARLQ